MTDSDIKLFFDVYFNNFITSISWDEQIHAPAAKEEWIRCLKNCGRSRYQLCIEDNGTLGHEIPDIHAETDSNKMENVSGGMGLSNIRDRVKALGGTVQITQEKGFWIFVTIPKSVSN